MALGYHLVSSPTAGVVGDVPVRVGDSVTRSTVLTTIDQNAGLEVYVNVPVQEAAHLRLGLPVHLVDDAGRAHQSTQLSFVSPSVDARNQSVLAKATLERPEGLRTEQFVRVRIVWTEAPGLTVPLVAVNRVNGQYFAFVAETEGGKTVARQRAVDLGAVVGNDYVVKSGLKPGEKLIVSGVQKIGDGAPVTIVGGRFPAAGPEGRVAVLSDVFIRRPILATVCSLLIILAGAICIPLLPIARYPALAPPSVTITAFYTGANAQAVESAVTTPIEQVVNGVEGMTYIQLLEHQQRHQHDQRLLRHRPRPRPRRGGRAEPGQPGARPPARRRAHHRRHGHQEHGRLHGRPRLLLEGQPLQRASSSATTSTSTCATRSSACPASATC